jgi:hypothetical protein
MPFEASRAASGASAAINRQAAVPVRTAHSEKEKDKTGLPRGRRAPASAYAPTILCGESCITGRAATSFFSTPLHLPPHPPLGRPLTQITSFSVLVRTECAHNPSGRFYCRLVGSRPAPRGHRDLHASRRASAPPNIFLHRPTTFAVLVRTGAPHATSVGSQRSSTVELGLARHACSSQPPTAREPAN